ncbi:MAG: hypothetical protein WC455_12850 [Dehalococcoidia bacterium]|jgi:hypothetical protein
MMSCEFLYKNEIVEVLDQDANYYYIHTSRTHPGYAHRVLKGDLTEKWKGSPKNIRKKLSRDVSPWREYWNPDGFFISRVDGNEYHCLHRHPRIPLGDFDDLIVRSKANRRVKDGKILDTIADEMGLKRGNVVYLRLFAPDGHIEEASWRSTAKQFEDSVEKYHLLAPGVRYEVVGEGFFRFSEVPA